MTSKVCKNRDFSNCGPCRAIGLIGGAKSANVQAEPIDNGNDVDRGFFGFGAPPPISLLHQGGQAEFMRVPFAQHNLIIVPAGKKNELDYLLLSDIWPTAWWALECAEQVIGDTVAVFGAGESRPTILIRQS